MQLKTTLKLAQITKSDNIFRGRQWQNRHVPEKSIIGKTSKMAIWQYLPQLQMHRFFDPEIPLLHLC